MEINIQYNSKAWNEKVAAIEKKIYKYRQKYGFIQCPKCKTIHTNKTVTCRNCEYKVKKS